MLTDKGHGSQPRYRVARNLAATAKLSLVCVATSVAKGGRAGPEREAVRDS